MSWPKLAIVSSHVIQHFAPVYRKLAESEKIEVKVFFLAENGAKPYRDVGFDSEFAWDVPLTEGYDHEFVEPGRVLTDMSFSSMDSTRLVPSLREYKPDFIWLNGYGMRVNWRVLRARPNNARIIYGSDSNLGDKRSSWRQFLKRPVVKYFLSRCDFFLSISAANSEYLTHYGVAPNQIIDSSYPVDIERFQIAANSLGADSRVKSRVSLGIPEKAMVLLFAGKLVDYKRPQDVIRVLQRGELSDIYLVIVGSGVTQQDLQQLAIDLDVSARVHFCGFVNQSEIGKYFKLADIFVFPSEREPYGAIAAETLPFGLPIISSDRIGAIGASIIPNKNALLYEAGNLTQLAACIQRLRDPKLRSDFAKRSEKLALQHDYSVMAHDIIHICCHGAHSQ